jgi:predicted peroxiredoxin
MKITNVLTICLVFIIVSCQNDSKPEISQLVKQEKHKDGIFIHVSSGYDNPHKTCMALSLAVKMAESKDVSLFFDIEGVKILTKDAKDIQMDDFMTCHGALDTLIQRNVQIMACPMCMAKAEIKPENLREGIIVAEVDKFFNFTKGRILTIDY